MNSYELNRNAGLDERRDKHEQELNGAADSSLTLRLCHIKKRNEKDVGYGFNLMSKRDKLCQYIGKVDPGTPAYEAGLRTGDKIVEIDNQNVSRMSYRQIIDLLRRGRRIGNNAYRPDELLLLVVDQGTDDFFRIANVQVSSKNTSIPIEFKSSQIKKIQPTTPPPSRPAPVPVMPSPAPTPTRADVGTNTSPEHKPASVVPTPQPPHSHHYHRFDLSDESDDLVDEISININLNSSGSGSGSGSASGGGDGRTGNYYSNSSFNSSTSTNNEDIELVTFV